MPPKVFLSYGHKDAWEFMHRLFFALELYLGRENLFWDTLIPPGPFPDHLKTTIEDCDFFVAVMSPYAARADGWCRRELEIALDSERPVLPAKLFDDFNDPLLIDSGQMTYADFSAEFEVGFRRLTEWILGEARSSWEYLGTCTDDRFLFEQLKNGHIPALIAKQAAEWVLVEYLWRLIDINLPDAQYFKARPRTLQGFLMENRRLLKQAIQLESRPVSHAVLIQGLQKAIEEYLQCIEAVRDSDHKAAGQCAMDAIDAVRRILYSNDVADRNAHEAIKIVRGLYDFEVAEKLRELILWYSRRSRYLY